MFHVRCDNHASPTASKLRRINFIIRSPIRLFNFACPGYSPQGRKHKLKEERRSQFCQRFLIVIYTESIGNKFDRCKSQKKIFYYF